MDRIPLEILVHIVKMAGESRWSWRIDAWQERPRTLANASLVARRWRQPAQEELWRTLRVLRESELEALLNSPALGNHRPQSVLISRLSPMQTVLLLAHCTGVTEVYIRNVKGEGIGCGFLSLPSLSALHTLAMHRCSFDTRHQGRIITSSALITDLYLVADDEAMPYPPALARTIFPGATLTTLHLPGKDVVQEDAPHLHLLSHSLAYLCVGGYASLPPFVDALAELRALKRLDYGGTAATLPGVIDTLKACTLDHVRLMRPSMEAADDCDSILASLALPAMQRLTTLDIALEESDDSRYPWLASLRTECKQRAIRLHRKQADR